mmetsp:Transcript_17473/g.54991  ORF Transcript_17473/g.54991 Transcript_17473/m.54991 type:complete len:275 (-) Transcript_17473:969-1793(-)
MALLATNGGKLTPDPVRELLQRDSRGARPLAVERKAVPTNMHMQTEALPSINTIPMPRHVCDRYLAPLPSASSPASPSLASSSPSPSSRRPAAQPLSPSLPLAAWRPAEVAGLSSRQRAEAPPSARATPARMKTQGSAAFSSMRCSMTLSAKWQISWPTVTQQFSRDICSAVLTLLPSFSAFLLRVATRPKGMAKEPVSGMTEKAMQTMANAASVPTTLAASKATTAPIRMQGAYTYLGRILVFIRTMMIKSEDTSCTPAFHMPADEKADPPAS